MTEITQEQETKVLLSPETKGTWDYGKFEEVVVKHAVENEYLQEETLPQEINIGRLGQELARLDSRTRKDTREWGRFIYLSKDEENFLAGEANSGDSERALLRDGLKDNKMVASMHTHPLSLNPKSFIKELAQGDRSEPGEGAALYFTPGDLLDFLPQERDYFQFELLAYDSEVLMILKTEKTPRLSRVEVDESLSRIYEQHEDEDQAFDRICDEFKLALYKGSLSGDHRFILERIETTP